MENKKWISHFHCPDCEECIDIGGKDLINIFEPTIVGDSTLIHVYVCPKCGRKTIVVVESAGGELKFGKFLKGEKNEQFS